MLQSMLLRFSSCCLSKSDVFGKVFTSTKIVCSQMHTVEDSSQVVGISDDDENEGCEPVDYEAQLKALMPSEEVWKVTPVTHHDKIKDVVKELEIYAYMSNFVPKSLSDDEWFRILKTTDSVAERVTFLEYVAVKQRRSERDQIKKSLKQDEFQAKLEEEREKFERGEMAYGPDMYQLIQNPMRNRKKIHIVQGARMVAAMRCNDRPKIALDLQYMFKEKPRILSELGNQMQYVISENLDSKNPFPITFVNFPYTEDSQKWLNQCVGFYGGQYTHQTVLPDFTDKGVNEVFPEDDLVYISRNARDVIDGPLNVGAIALCVSKDSARESLGAARRSRIRAVRLPIQKYVKWQQGPMYLPFPNIMRIFREVHLSGGDWRTALLNNISKRHLIPPEEQKSEMLVERRNRRKARQREKNELIKTIQEATGHS